MQFYELIDVLCAEAENSEEQHVDGQILSLRAYIKCHRPDVQEVWALGEPESEATAFRQGTFIGMADMLRLFNKHGLPDDLAEVLGV